MWTGRYWSRLWRSGLHGRSRGRWCLRRAWWHRGTLAGSVPARGFRLNHLSNDPRARLLLSRLAVGILSVCGTAQKRAPCAERERQDPVCRLRQESTPPSPHAGLTISLSVQNRESSGGIGFRRLYLGQELVFIDHGGDGHFSVLRFIVEAHHRALASNPNALGEGNLGRES